MFNRLLVANRGEVAVRFARTCRKMSISPVAVYSEADAGAPWLNEFDEAVCVGPAHPGRSYLNQDAILEAAVQTDCQALHPGWGFLAENALFATRVHHHKLAWIGPSGHAIRLMGDKALARETVKAAGLPTIPGSEGVLADLGEARVLAEEIGYPVLLKATAGGGGKGMRICRGADTLEQAFTEASREAEASFSNPGLYLEKFIEAGRHIEFQVLADRWGKVLHFGERECSVQRRHQKLVEEAPSPIMTEKSRAHYGDLVCRAVAAVGYEGAGTVEFLRSPEGKLYFMEMNTRLQVEHPVTEMITGEDLVEWQLRIAADEKLTLEQSEVVLRGHAIEARINAEDPSQDFRPSPGRITRFDFPAEVKDGTIRVDTHIVAPAEVPPFYDSLVAKVIAHGETREKAIAALEECLSRAVVEGVPTTIPAHLKILRTEGFSSGTYDTSLLDTLDLSS